MKDIHNSIIQMILSVGLTQKELFVDKVSAVIAEKMEADPENSQQIAQGIISMAESFKEQLFVSQIAKRSSSEGNSELIEKLDQLNRSINELNQTLKEKK